MYIDYFYWVVKPNALDVNGVSIDLSILFMVTARFYLLGLANGRKKPL